MEQLNEVLKNSNAALLKESNYLAAIGMLNDAIESFPNFAALYLNRGCLFAKYDTTEQATLDFAKVLELDPTDYLSYFNLFTLHYKLGNFPLAYDMLCCCISNSYLRRGIISNHQGDLTKALKFCQNNLWVFVGKTVLNFIQKKYVLAQKAINLALEIQKDNPLLYQLRARIWQNMSKEDARLQDLQNALRLLQEKQKLSKSIKRNPIMIVDKVYKLESSMSLTAPTRHQFEQKLEQFGLLHSELEKQQSKSQKANIIFEDKHKRTAAYMNQLISSIVKDAEPISQVNVDIARSTMGIPKHSSAMKISVMTAESIQSEIILEKNSQLQIIQPKNSEIKINQVKNSQIKTSEEQKISQLKKSEIKIIFSQTSDLQSSEFQYFDLNLTPNVILAPNHKPPTSSQSLYPLNHNSRMILIKVVSALLTNNKQLFGKMDPYCKLSYAGQTFQSQIHTKGGFTPVWNYQVSMQLTPEPRELLLEVYDKETLKNDDFVGSGSFILTSIGKLKVPIFEQYKSAGQVYIEIEKI